MDAEAPGEELEELSSDHAAVSSSSLTATSPVVTGPKTFSKLPAELRLQIWKYACWNLPGRIIPIKLRPPYYPGSFGLPLASFQCSSPQSHISLYYEDEALKDILRKHHVLFESSDKGFAVTANLENDTLLLLGMYNLRGIWLYSGLSALRNVFREGKMEEVKKVAILHLVSRKLVKAKRPGRPHYFQVWADHEHFNTVRRLHCVFPSLKLVVFIPVDSLEGIDDRLKGEMSFVETRGPRLEDGPCYVDSARREYERLVGLSITLGLTKNFPKVEFMELGP